MPTETIQEVKTFEQATEKAREDLKAESTPAPPAPSTPEPEPAKVEPEKPAEAPEVAPGPADVEATEDSLLPPEDVKKLSPSDQETYRKMQKAFTQKTQAVATERRRLENLVKVSEAFERDPRGTLKLLAEQQGLKFQEEAALIPQPAADKPLVEELKEALGPDLDILADKLAPILEKIARQAETKIDDRIRPLTQQQAAQTAAKQAEAIMQTFLAKHPDHKRYEPRMNELASKILPSGEVTEMEYLEYLYEIASGGERAVVEALNANRKAAAGNEPLPPGGVNPEKVSPTMPKGLSFSDSFDRAFELAKQGITVKGD